MYLFIFKGMAVSFSIHDYRAEFYPTYRLPHRMLVQGNTKYKSDFSDSAKMSLNHKQRLHCIRCSVYNLGLEA